MTPEEMLQVAREFVAVARSHAGWTSLSIAEGKEHRPFAERKEFVSFLEAVVPILERESAKGLQFHHLCPSCRRAWIDSTIYQACPHCNHTPLPNETMYFLDFPPVEREAKPDPQRAHTLAIMAASLYASFDGSYGATERVSLSVNFAETILQEVEKREG